MPALAEYQRHAELFGPDCVLATAARELEQRNLVQLKGFIDHLERTQRFVRGSWRPRHDKPPRKCRGCGLDLPLTARANRHFHDDACRLRERRSRDTDSDSTQKAGAGRNPVASPPQAGVRSPQSPDHGAQTLAA